MPPDPKIDERQSTLRSSDAPERSDLLVPVEDICSGAVQNIFGGPHLFLGGGQLIM